MPIEFPFTVKDFLLGGVIPAVVAAAVSLLAARFLAHDCSRSIVANWGISIAFFIGIRLLNLSPWKPASHWHWLPYLGLACAVLTPLIVHRNAAMRFAPAVFMAGISAYFLVPDWSSLPQPRSVMVCGFATSLIAVWLVMRPVIWDLLSERFVLRRGIWS